MVNRFIKVKSLVCIENTITVELDFSRNLKRFFHQNSFYIRYGKDISRHNYSILVIPVVFCLDSISWTLGADLIVDSIDRDAFESSRIIRKLFNKRYPSNENNSVLRSEKIIETRSVDGNSGLLFSGGIDALHSLKTKINDISVLYNILGLRVCLDNLEYYKNWKLKLSKTAKKLDKDIEFIETNFFCVFNFALLNGLYKKHFDYVNWDEAIGQAIIPLGLCAPVAVDSISELLISSSFTESYKELRGADPVITDSLRFYGIQVKQIGYEYNRTEKILQILSWLKENEIIPEVCNTNHVLGREGNCGVCDKCARTSVTLLLEDENLEILDYPLMNRI